MAELMNPMKRLYNLLEQVVSYAEAEQYSQSSAMSMVWGHAMAFEMDDEDDLEGYHNSLMDLMRLIATCEDIIKKTPSMNQSLYLSQMSRIKRAAFSIGSSTWGNFRNEFTNDFLLAMQWAIEGMNEFVSEEVISDDDLQNMHAELQGIIDRLLPSDLPTEFKTSLVDGLTAIQLAIQDYRLFGAEGIRNAIDRNVGLLYRHLEDSGDLEQSESKDVARDAINCIWRIDKIVSATSKVKGLAQPIIEHFPMLGSG